MFFKPGINTSNELLYQAQIIIEANLKEQTILTTNQALELFDIGEEIAAFLSNDWAKEKFCKMLYEAKYNTKHLKAKNIYLKLAVDFRKSCKPLLNDIDYLFDEQAMSPKP